MLGTLLLGNADLRTKEKELKEELKPYLSDIRVISMNESGCDGKASEEFLEFLGSRNKHLTSFIFCQENSKERKSPETDPEGGTTAASLPDRSGSRCMLLRFSEKQIRDIKKNNRESDAADRKDEPASLSFFY